MSDTIHQMRLDKIYDLLPCIRGKPTLTYEQTHDSSAHYCWMKHQINLNLHSIPEPSRLFQWLEGETVWVMMIAHEYSHAYIDLSIGDRIAYNQHGPEYIRHEKDMDRLAAVIVRALTGEEEFLPADKVRSQIAQWHQYRSQHFSEIAHQWAAKMRVEYPPIPSPLPSGPPPEA